MHTTNRSGAEFPATELPPVEPTDHDLYLIDDPALWEHTQERLERQIARAATVTRLPAGRRRGRRVEGRAAA